MRKALSKKTRFEIFKRDKFCCVYCGANPGTGATLNVDHVIAVANGGTNDEMNLVTSCFDCNSGKSDRPLTEINKTSKVTKEQLKEYKEQVELFFAFLNKKNEAVLASIEMVVNRLGNPLNFTDQNRVSIKRFINDIGLEKSLEAADIANVKKHTDYSRFKYFCGICHNMRRSKENV